MFPERISCPSLCILAEVVSCETVREAEEVSVLPGSHCQFRKSEMANIDPGSPGSSSGGGEGRGGGGNALTKDLA